MAGSVRKIAPHVRGERGADRGIVAGRSGSGKSYLCMELLSLYSPSAQASQFRANVLVIDPNGTFDYPADDLIRHPNALKWGRRTGTVLYRPDPEQLNAGDLNELFRRLFLAQAPSGALLCYVDELYALESLFRTTARFGEDRNWLRAYLTQGRARNRAFLASVQRPANVPRDVFAQAEWFYVFDLPLEDDRRTMAGMIGRKSADGADTLDRAALGRYEFWHVNPEIDNPKRLKLAG